MESWEIVVRILRACFSFSGVSVELMALLMLLSWNPQKRKKIIKITFTVAAQTHRGWTDTLVP